MKRVGELYERVSDWDNLRLAFSKAAKGKSTRADVLAYRRDLDRHLGDLQRRIRDQDVEVGNYRYFTIYEPKMRTICAAPFSERVLHHAIMNVLEPVLERFQIHDSYACRPGKGTDAALRRSLFFTRRFRHFAKLDVRKYFDSIPHDRLLRRLERRVKDRRLLDLIGTIVDSYCHTPGRGLPIGNLTSQHLANFYLAHGDHLVKDRLRVRGYLRYMDDMLVFHDHADVLRGVVEQIDSCVSDELGLRLKPVGFDVCILGRSDQGVPFLGFLVRPTGIYAGRKKRSLARRRAAAGYQAVVAGRWGQREYADHMQSVFAHMALARSRAFRRHLVSRWDPGLRVEPGETRR